MRYEFITALNRQLDTRYGARCRETWQFEPVIYWQDQIYDTAWEAWRRHAQLKETGDFEHTCVRFSHKVQAQIAHARRTTADVMIWLDSDVIQTHSFTPEDLEPVLPQGDELCTFLSRAPVKYSETGWIAYNTRHPRFKEFMRRLEDMYLSHEIWSLAQWHDAYVWDHCRVRGAYAARSLLAKPKTKEPMRDSELGAWFHHLKGARKVQP